MIKRNESKSASSRRKRTDRSKSDRAQKRRLTMEGLESRQLLAVLTEPPIQPAPTNLPVFDAPRNIGTVQASAFFESETALEIGENDTRTTAEFVPIGTAPGRQDTIDITGSLPIRQSNSLTGFRADIDTYRMTLRAGDILDVATAGAAGQFTITNSRGQNLLTATEVTFGATGPRQNAGNAASTFVVPEDDDYFLTVGASGFTTAYTIGLRAYRPVTESLAVGDTQILYLNWEGGIVDNNLFNFDIFEPPLPNFGFTVVPNFNDTLPLIGVEDGDLATAERITTDVYTEVIETFADLGQFGPNDPTGTNGNFGTTGTPGDFAIRILSSRVPEHFAWFQANADDPRITEMLIGGTGVDIGVPGVFGIAESADVGNFNLREFGLFALDGFLGTTLGVQLSPNVSSVDATVQFLASVIAHEAGHVFGMRHTVNTNTIASLSDAGGTLEVQQGGLGAGLDGIFGTVDDVQPIFQDDFYTPDEELRGFQRISANLSHALSSGTRGGVSLTGRVFDDANRNGVDNNDGGIGGVRVFADTNRNGVLDGSDAQAVTAANGSYSLVLPPGVFDVQVVSPENFVSTTPTLITSNNGPISFGFSRVNSDITGSVFVDSDGDGLRDANEGGLGDIFVYADLDGDNRPDLGEPNTRTNILGDYSINFPGPGTFTIRIVTPTGFEQTFPDPDPPTDGEHTFVFNGTSVGDNFDFGFLPSRDFGDAPDSYGTTLSANGASHGIVSGLQIGGAPDRELDGQPSGNATGDDLNGGDDEDGVFLATPLGPGSAATFEVTVTNTTGAPAFLHTFVDFNRDGDFNDAGEQLGGQLISTGTNGSVVDVVANVPANAGVGQTFARFRLSNQSSIGPTGFVNGGEVEDYAFTIQNAADIVVDDSFQVSRNSRPDNTDPNDPNNFDLLANDFDTLDNPLTIDTLDLQNTAGSVVVRADRRTVDYTPPLGFTGPDSFRYSVSDSSGNPIVDDNGNVVFADVTVNVTFLSNVPIAVDDSFQVPQGSANRPLNVLANDVSSTFGGNTITSVTPGTSGGNIQIIGGGQSLRYTPQPGFNGTEQFTYSIQDPNGSSSSATVTVNLLPGSQADDVVDFSIGIFEVDNIDRPKTTAQVGEEFLVRVFVEDLRSFANPEGVASAFLDLLYTDELVSVLGNESVTGLPFDISFGELFQPPTIDPDTGLPSVVGSANAETPGLIDEVGGLQSITNQQQHTGPVELFTIRMVASSPGVALFQGDPADAAQSETVVLASDVALLVRQLRFGTAELDIRPDSDNFTAAIDDSFADRLDSNGQTIISTNPTRNVLDVLANDNLGESGRLIEFELTTNPSFGNAFRDDNGTPFIDDVQTPGALDDDFISYRPNANVNGLESFSYVIVTADGVRSTAEVTIPLGNTNANAEVAFDFALVGADGVTPVTSVAVGQTFGIQVNAEDLRSFGTYVFAGYLDVLYDQTRMVPNDTIGGDEYDFDVVFGTEFEADAGVGTSARPGIIDEFGTLRSDNGPGNDDGRPDPAELATIFFTATAPGIARVAGSPADSFPFQDTLLFNEDNPIELSRIRYDVLEVNITSGGGGGGGGGGSTGNITAFQNPLLAQDVNNDGAVSSIDALLVINAMSRLDSGLGEGEEGSGSSLVTSFYADVNGDSRISALDALQVINYLSRRANGGSGEGELVSIAQPLSSSATDLSSDAASDAVFADLDDDDLLVDVGNGNSGAPVSLLVGSSNPSDDESDDELDFLSLLADDQSGL